MKPRFPITDVDIEISHGKKEVDVALYDDGYYRLNQNEFSMDVEGVGWFYVSDGRHIYVSCYPGCDLAAVELYLNGSVYGAVLHQRKIVPMHGSCFRYHGIGVMLCGDTGAGKSSLTASFCLNGAEFLTDDITPLLYRNGKPYIWALSDRMKLWSDALRQLEKDEKGLHRIDPVTEKYYYPMDKKQGNRYRLHRVYVIEVTDNGDVVFEELSGSSRFATLRNEIYRPEYLQGMPENEPVYFNNLIDLGTHTRVFRIRRSNKVLINELMLLMKKHMDNKK